MFLKFLGKANKHGNLNNSCLTLISSIHYASCLEKSVIESRLAKKYLKNKLELVRS